MTPQQIIAEEAAVIAPTYVRAPVVFDHGLGAMLYDGDGNAYLDFAGGIAVTALGHGDADWAAAVSEQAGKLAHVSNLYHTAPHVALARRLVDRSFADRVFFCNSGAEANEAALKFARKVARLRFERADKSGFVAFSGGFHGRTVGALSVTYKSAYREPFAPLMPGVRFAPFNDAAAALTAIDADTCAVIVEPVQGEGGVQPATANFLRVLRQACDQHGALLIFDEVQCGLGRTGTLWAHEAYGVTPDIMTLAKPLAGGLPIGATLMTEAVAAALQPGDHGSTFAAGPLVCRAATVVFDRVSQPAFLEAVRRNGDHLRQRLEALDDARIVEVRGAGLLVGVEMRAPVAPLVAGCLARGLVVINAGTDVLRLAPPLIVTREQIDAAVDTIAAVLAKVE